MRTQSRKFAKPPLRPPRKARNREAPAICKFQCGFGSDVLFANAQQRSREFLEARVSSPRELTFPLAEWKTARRHQRVRNLRDTSRVHYFVCKSETRSKPNGA